MDNKNSEGKRYRIVKRRGGYMPQKLYGYSWENMLYIPCKTVKEAEQEIEYDKGNDNVVGYY